MDVLLCQIYLQLLVVALVKDVIRLVKSVGNGNTIHSYSLIFQMHVRKISSWFLHRCVDCSRSTDPCHLKPGQLPYCPANGASGDGCVR